MARRNVFLMLGGGGLLAAALVFWLASEPPSRAADAAPPQAVPITAQVAKAEDVPVLLRGLGNVTAFATVQIKAQVNGTLVAVPVREGQEVRRGDILAEIDPRPYQAALDQASAQRQGDQAQLLSAQLDLRRYQELAKRQFAPVQQVDDQQATVNKLVAAVAADEAAMETARINLGYCVIHAPIDGRVGLYQLDAGNLIQAASQTPIISITQDRPISVVFSLPEAQLAQVQDAMARGTVAVQAWSADDSRKLADGTLLTPDNAIDTTSGTIRLKAVFDNQDGRLWPGAFVNARLLADTLHQVVTVPLVAVQHGPDGLFVYVVKPDSTVTQQKISLGYQEQTRAVVSQGLGAGDQVVTAGQSRLSPGTHVAVRHDEAAS